MATSLSTESIALQAAFQATGGGTGRIVRVTEIMKLCALDPASLKAAVRTLISEKLLLIGNTDEFVCLSPAGAAIVRGSIKPAA